MDQCEDREEGVPPSKSTLCGEHESQTKAQRSKMEKPSPVQLLEMLKNLGEEELKIFHFYLQYEPGADFPKIYKCQLENADRLKTVEVMVQVYSDHVMEVARSILGRLKGGSPSAQAASSLSSEETLQCCQLKLKCNLKDEFECVFEGIAKAGNPTLLNQIYTELYITEGGTAEVSDEHEVRHIETASRKPDRLGTTIRREDIFKASPGRNKSIRTVLTKGVAGIGKTFLTQKYTLDWAEDKANQDIQFIFLFTFRELNVLKEEKFSLVGLVHRFFTETKEAGICSFEDFQVVFIFDGLDECRLPLDFHKTTILTDPRESTSVDVLLINLIRGKLLPSARLWITTRPAAANQIPPQCVGRVTEIRGFIDPQKEEYFRKRFIDEEQASRIISHIKTSRSLHIMCHIPVFCWITATVLEDVLETREGGQLPKTLTEMYIHFLVVQAKVKKAKYDGGAETDPHWSPESRKMMESLGKLAFDQLQKGNLIFYESDLTECGIDIRAASVYSGVFTQIFKEERGLYQDKVFCFIHLSVQEFLAALHVHLTFINSGLNLLNLETTHLFKTLRTKYKLHFFYQSAVNKALQSPNGHLDLFLRFLLGLSLQTNQTLLRGLLTQTGSSSQTNQETVQYIKMKLSENLSAEKSINLFHCLSELKDHSLVEEIQQSLRSGSLSTDKLSPAQWSALVFILLSSEKDVDVFDVKNYSASEEALLRLLPVVKASKKALLSGSNLSERSCDALCPFLISHTSTVMELDLSNNDLHDAGVKLLSAGLRSPDCPLKKLSLSGCLITEEGCISLASALSSNPSHLRELDLSYNHPGDSGDSGIKLLSAGVKDPCWRLDTLRVEPAGERWLTPGLRKYSCQLTIDTNTVHTNLQLSGNNRKVTPAEVQSYPDHPDRFDAHPQLLCRNGLTGRCYWEVEWRGKVYISVSYRRLRRKGDSDDCLFGWNDQSWSLRCRNGGAHSVWHNSKKQSIPSSSSSCVSNRVAVYVDCPAGTLSFYKVSSDTLIHLHTFNTTFTEPLYPGFSIWSDPPDSSLTLC
uniref:B30.2/SPRY domain-containing protein n=1 Tax=Astatotilapia calliptera TaxID=8154 RepID=A0AAX7VW73_ASTCA